MKVQTGQLSAWQAETVAPASWSGFTIYQVQDFTYDAVGRKTKETLSHYGVVQTLVQISYDGLGRLQCTAVRMNPAEFAAIATDACIQNAGATNRVQDRITSNVYNPAGEVVKVRTGVDRPDVRDLVSKTYTANGKLEYVTDANGNKARLQYDGHDRQSHWWFPHASTTGNVSTVDYESYGYDANSNRTSLRKRSENGQAAGSQTILYAYDALNRPTLKDVPGTAGDVAYTYDLRGLQLTAKYSATNTGITNVYDDAGRLVSTANNLGTARTLAFEHDANSNRTRITHPDGVYFTYAHDGRDRVTTIHENGDVQLAKIDYDGLGRRTLLTHGSGPGSTTYSYDGASRLDLLQHNFTGTASDVSTSFAYNPADQIVTAERSNDLFAFAKANAAVGYTANGLNQYNTVGGAARSYDKNGNLTSKDGTTFAYDIENRLLTATGTKTGTFAYDPLGRLWTRRPASATTQFHHDGDDLVLEYLGGTINRRYVHGPGTDEPLVEYVGSGLTDRRHLHADHQGSIVATSDPLGNRIAINSYDEYGVPAPANVGRFSYTGQIWLPELEVHHYKARVYDPEDARFFQVDPIEYEGGWNLYGYVMGDPVNDTDSTGELPDAILDVGFIIADAIDIKQNGLNWTNGVSLGANIVGAAIPGATGLGLGTRAVMKGDDVARANEKLSKVQKSTSTRQIGKFTEKTKIIPGKGPGQSRAEIKITKNSDGKTIRTYKDSYDRSGEWKGRKPMRGGPEGRRQNDDMKEK